MAPSLRQFSSGDSLHGRAQVAMYESRRDGTVPPAPCFLGNKPEVPHNVPQCAGQTPFTKLTLGQVAKTPPSANCPAISENFCTEASFLAGGSPGIAPGLVPRTFSPQGSSAKWRVRNGEAGKRIRNEEAIPVLIHQQSLAPTWENPQTWPSLVK